MDFQPELKRFLELEAEYLRNEDFKPSKPGERQTEDLKTRDLKICLVKLGGILKSPFKNDIKIKGLL